MQAKLKRPFKSPMPHVNVRKIADSIPTAPIVRADATTAMPQTATECDLANAAQFATKRSLQPFRPPHSKTGASVTSHSQRDQTAEIAALEREVRILKQAVNLVRKREEDNRLAELVIQWREAGRIIVERLFSLVPQPEKGAEAKPYDEWDGGAGDIDKAAHDEAARTGLDEQAETQAQEWTMGSMMLSLRVDPGLLGWSSEAGDWEAVVVELPGGQQE